MTIIMYHKNKQKTIITVPNSRFCQRWKIQKRWPLGIAHNVYSDSNNMLASVPLFNSLKRGYCSKQDRCGEIRTRENRGVLEISEYRLGPFTLAIFAAILAATFAAISSAISRRFQIAWLITNSFVLKKNSRFDSSAWGFSSRREILISERLNFVNSFMDGIFASC